MHDLRATAAGASVALFVLAAPAVGSQPTYRVEATVSRAPQLPANFGIARSDDDVEPAIEGVDFGELTDADVAMMRHALQSGAEEVDFSEFYLDDDE